MCRTSYMSILKISRRPRLCAAPAAKRHLRSFKQPGMCIFSKGRFQARAGRRGRKPSPPSNALATCCYPGRVSDPRGRLAPAPKSYMSSRKDPASPMPRPTASTLRCQAPAPCAFPLPWGESSRGVKARASQEGFPTPPSMLGVAAQDSHPAGRGRGAP